MTAWLMVLLAATPVDGGSNVPTISGSLDKEIIRRVIRAHMGRVRHCYEETLVKKPEASGKVMMSFTIEKTGKVSQAETKENTVGDDAMSACVAQAVLAMTFPEPKGGGKVIVNYPFVFSTAK